MDILFPVFILALIVVCIAGSWKVYAKAGQPGWAAIIPIYNIYIMTKIVGRPWWWMLLFLVPVVSLVIAIIMMIDLAKAFGKGTGFGIGLVLLGAIFMCILGFGDATYKGVPVHA